MKLFWIMVLCSAVITLVLSKPSEGKTLTRAESKVHQDALADPRMMSKRLKRASDDDDDDGEDNQNPGLTGGIFRFVGGILKFIGNIFTGI
ncbi:unnamed protein product [Larinioides sclopetarius]|uniref:Uncharacterized protein n=1 Tax=Larinioides sclopetarius TaxID=280406 RepID=A0AAV2AH79_9ARAC